MSQAKELAMVLEESKKEYEVANPTQEQLPQKPKLIKLKVFIGEEEIFDDVCKSRLLSEILRERLGK